MLSFYNEFNDCSYCIYKQRPMQASDVKGKPSTMTGRRKAELQNIATGHPSNQVTMETVEERAHRIKVYNAMKAKQALHTSEKMIVSAV